MALELEKADHSIERLTKLKRHKKEGLRCYREFYEENKDRNETVINYGIFCRSPTSPSPSLASTPQTLALLYLAHQLAHHLILFEFDEEDEDVIF